MKRRLTQSRPKGWTTEKKVYKTEAGTTTAALANVDWYTRPREELHTAVFARVRQIKSLQIARRYGLCAFQQAYHSQYGPQLAASLFAPGARQPSNAMHVVSANVIKSCTDTATARIAKEKPRAFILPNKGDYRLKRKARNLQKFVDGAMQAARVYENGDDVFRDACIYGTGALLIEAKDGVLRSEVIKQDELIIDDVDGMYDDPNEIHWTHPVPRAELLERYPDDAEAINEARGAWRGAMSFMSNADMVEVTRSWRRPAKKDGKPGRYTVSIATKVLEDEEWTKDYIPILRFHYTPPTYGPFGKGVAEELYGMQQVITGVLRGVVKSIRMFAVPRVWVSKLAGVTSQTISNEISVNTYAGEKPVFDTPPAASPDIYQFIQWCIDWCYKQLGLSQLTAQSEKPAGLNSGVAMRTYQDVETQRFALVGQRWERFYLQCARVIIDTASDLYAANDNGLSVKVPGRGFIQTIDWKDAKLEPDQYDLQIWATSILPQTPEGRLQTAQEYVNSGFMPKDVAISELHIPILNDWIDRETAARDNIEMCISSILDDSRYIEPDPISNIGLALSEAQSALLRAQYDKVGDGKIEMLGRFVGRCAQLAAQAAAPPPGAMPPAAPGAPAGQAPPPPPAPLAPAGSGAVPMPAAA